MYHPGIFRFNIFGNWEHIHNGTLAEEKDDIDVDKYYSGHYTAQVYETHLPTVDTSQPVLQAEISPRRAIS